MCQIVHNHGETGSLATGIAAQPSQGLTPPHGMTRKAYRLPCGAIRCTMNDSMPAWEVQAKGKCTRQGRRRSRCASRRRRRG